MTAKPIAPPWPRLSPQGLSRWLEILRRERDIRERALKFGTHPTALEIVASCDSAIEHILTTYPEVES